MDWVLYILLTSIFYIIALSKLKAQTERDKIGSTRIFFTAVIFFIIFEYVFIPSIVDQFIFHIIGLLVSILYALSIYFYLRSSKKKLDIIFKKMVIQNQGTISVLSFMQATQLSQREVQEYLEKMLKQFKGHRTKTEGNIYYEFYEW